MSDDKQIVTTLGALVAADPSLQRVLATKLAAKPRYHAVKLAKLVEAEVKHFAVERDKIVGEYGTDREPTGVERARFGPDKIKEVTPDNPHWVDVNRQIRELLDLPVTIPWGPLTSDMLAAADDLPGEVWLGLGPLFELGDAPKDGQ